MGVPRDPDAAQASQLFSIPLTALGRGDFCAAFTDAEGTVYRVARHEKAARAIRREAALLREMAGRLPVPVPALSYHEEPVPHTRHPVLAGEVLTRYSDLVRYVDA